MSKSKGKGMHNDATQPMISSFFSQKSTSPSSPSHPPARRARPDSSPVRVPGSASAQADIGAPIDLTMDSDSEAEDNHRDNGEPRAKRRKLISSTSLFFPTSQHSTTGSRSGSGPGAKNQSIQLTLSSPQAPIPNKTRDISATERYRFDPTAPAVEEPRSTTEERIRRERKERAKRILLGDRGIFSRGDVPDKSSHANEAGIGDEGDIPADGSGEESGEDDSDKKFQEMLSMFAESSSKGKKSKSSAKEKAVPQTAGGATRTKKVGEIGPSGLPYTPLELQVCIRSVDLEGRFMRFE